MLRTAAQQQASQMPVDPKLKATPPENFSRTLQLAAIPARPDMQQVMPLGVSLSELCMSSVSLKSSFDS